MKSLDRLRAVPWHALEPAWVAAALDDVLGGQPADKALERVLKAHRTATAEQRTATAEAIFGVGLWRRRLGEGTGLQRLRRLIDGHPEPAAFADRFSLPDWLAAELQRTGEDPEALADALNLPGPICLRANTLKISRDALALRLAAEGVQTVPGRHARDCLVVTTPRPNLYGLAASTDALFEVQDEGSQLLGELVGAQPGDAVIDFCAGAGGKALQLSAHVGSEGRVHATDVDLARLERLRTRAARAGASNISLHGKTLPAGLQAPCVLVDAPCSELGALRRGPDLRWRLDPAAFAPLPALQLSLLTTAARHVAPGGRLVYATCTFRPEENEDVAAAFEQRHPGFTRVGQALEVWPHREGTDAFFASLWRAPDLRP